MTWQRALGIGLGLQFVAGIILAAVIDKAGIDGDTSAAGLFVFAVLFVAGSVMVLAGTIGWGVKIGLREREREEPFISGPKPPTRAELGG